MSSSFVTDLVSQLKTAANPELAAPMAAYMKNLFPYLGIKSPERKKIFSAHWKNCEKPDYQEAAKIVKEMWALPEREIQYCAVGLLNKNKKEIKPETIKLIEWLITHKSWWDTVDALHDVTGLYFRQFPEKKTPITEKWMASGNFWLQRMCLIFQLNYKHETDKELLENYTLQLAGEREFFIRKAIGWALRQYSYSNPEWVRQFIETHRQKLSGLSIREGMKQLNRLK